MLSEKALSVDYGFPHNDHVEFIDNELIIRKHVKEDNPVALERIDKMLTSRLPQKNILDILVVD